jgi:6-phosphofructokinase 1
MKRIAVFTSGGDAPGMNACIRAVVRGAVYHEVEVFGIKRGYDGMIRGDIVPMNSHSVSNIIQKGGTILKSARSKEFFTKEGRQRAYDQLQKHEIEGLVAIGGNGTFTGAEIFCTEFGIPTVGAPGTIDNDLYGTDYTIGFDTAVIKSAIRQTPTTAFSLLRSWGVTPATLPFNRALPEGLNW